MCVDAAMKKSLQKKRFKRGKNGMKKAGIE